MGQAQKLGTRPLSSASASLPPESSRADFSKNAHPSSVAREEKESSPPFRLLNSDRKASFGFVVVKNGNIAGRFADPTEEKPRLVVGVRYHCCILCIRGVLRRGGRDDGVSGGVR